MQTGRLWITLVPSNGDLHPLYGQVHSDNLGYKVYKHLSVFKHTLFILGFRYLNEVLFFMKKNV